MSNTNFDSNSDSTLDRRRFLRLAAASVTTVSLGSLLGTGSALAADKLAVTDPTAVALAYVEKAESSKDPAYKKGTKCDTCVLYATAQAAGGYAPCGAVGGKLVAGTGWCKAYSPKPG